MKREDLFEAIGDVDDMLLEENVAPARRRWMPFFASAAACIAIIAVAAKTLPERQIETVERQQTDILLETEIKVTETYYRSLPGMIPETEPPTAVEDTLEDISEAVQTEAPDLTELSTSGIVIVETGTEPKAEVHYTEPKYDPDSFCYALTQIHENQSYMGISFNTYPAYDISGNQFAIYDVDGDGSEELVFLWKETDMASMLGMIFGRDAEGKIMIEFWGNPFIHIYSNGLIKHDASHNQGRDGRFWPYTLCKYDPASDTYEAEYSVGAWDSEAQPVPDEPYPEDADVSGSGIVYYIGERGPLDVTEFQAWEAETFGDAYEIDLPFRSFTAENIAAVDQ